MTNFVGWHDVAISDSIHNRLLQQLDQRCKLAHDTVTDIESRAGLLATRLSHTPTVLLERDGLRLFITGHPTLRNQPIGPNDTQALHQLVADYRQHSAQCLTALGGQFVLAIWDANNKSVLLAVDKFASIALRYRSVKNQGLWFASHNDHINAGLAQASPLNQQAIYDYFYFHAIPSPETIYQDIQTLEPAQYLLWQNGKISQQFYWTAKFDSQQITDKDTLSAALLPQLRKAVKKCVPNDTTGCFLSGGTDSSTVAGLLSEQQANQTNCFSIGFAEQGYDEIGFARIAAQHFSTKLHEYYVTAADVTSAIPDIVAAYDEPFGNSSAIPTLFCARLAHQHGIHTLLAGDGGDEIFAGNERYAKQKIFNWYFAVPQLIRQRIIEPLALNNYIGHSLAPIRKLQSYIEQAKIAMPERTESYNLLNREPLDTIFNDAFLANVNPNHPIELLQQRYKLAESEDLVEQMLHLDWKFTLADNDLQKVGRMCDLAGIAVKYPFLDDELLDFSCQVPASLKLRQLKLRYFYKYALRDFLPSEVIHKSKHGFGLPFGQWLKSYPALQNYIYGRLESFKSREIMRGQFIDQIMHSHQTKHAAYYGTMVWIIATFEEWLQINKH